MSSNFPHFVSLTKRLGILVGIYEICRILFFLFNKDILPSSSIVELSTFLLYGLRFDLSAIIYTNSLFILMHILPLPLSNRNGFQQLLKIIFYLINIPAVILSLADIEYFRYSLKRSTAEVLQNSADFINVLPQYILDFSYLIVVLVILITLMEYAYRKTNTADNQQTKGGYIIQLLMFILGGSVFFILARGGLQIKPLSPINATQFSKVGTAPIITNTPFEILYSIGKPDVKKFDFFTENELATQFNFCKKPDSTEAQPISKPNVLVIVLESFSAELLKTYHSSTQSHAPFLDSLAKKSIVFRHMFANGTRSVEGIPAICASIPALMEESFIFSIYQTNNFDGLGTLLKRIGYSTAFFHGGHNGTFQLNSFANAAGFDQYFGMNEYANSEDYDGSWGIYDEPFFNFTAQQLNQLDTPFGAVLFSLSSHHPYKIPSRYLTTLKETDPFLRSVQYTDIALRNFFKTASKMSWFKNTLFVITADHHGPALGQDKTWLDRFRIPLIIYNPANESYQKLVNPVQQVDILPGILDYLNYPYSYCSFGNSLFDTTANRAAYQYMHQTYQIIDNKYLIRFEGSSITGIYDYKIDGSLLNNLIDEITPNQINLSNYLKAILQQYGSAMTQNKLSQKVSFSIKE